MGRGEYWRLVDSQGRPPGLLGMWPSRAVSFIENHDTGSTLNHWPFPQNHLHEGYAYIMTHPGTPCIFWDHFWSDGLGDSIRALINVRRKHSLQCRSKVRPQPICHDFILDTLLMKQTGSHFPGKEALEKRSFGKSKIEGVLLWSGQDQKFSFTPTMSVDSSLQAPASSTRCNHTQNNCLSCIS